MPIPSLKNPGPLLSFEQLGEQVQIPREFIAAMELKETVQAVNEDVQPDALSDTVIFSRIETNRTNERVKHNWFKKPGNIVLLDYSTETDGQITQTTRTLYPTASVMPIVIGNQKYTVKDLGNGWSIQEVAIEGEWGGGSPPVFIQKVFAGNRFETRKNDPVPVEFQGQTPIKSQEFSQAGTAVQPVLLSDDLLKWEQDVDTYIKRVHNESRDTTKLPVVLTGQDTNNLGQVVTVTKTYKLDPSMLGAGQTPATTALRQVSVEPLGGDPTSLRVIQTQREVDVVPPLAKWTVQVEDGVPLAFRASVPTTTSEIIDTPVATGPIPNLPVGELVHETENLDVFRKRTRIVSRAVGATALDAREWRGPKDGEGSEFTSIVTKASSLVAPSTALAPDKLVLDTKITPISPTQSLLETSTAKNGFVALSEIIQDKKALFKVTRTKSIVDAGFVPINPPSGTFYQTRALDTERSELIQETAILGIDGSGVVDVYQKFDGQIDVSLPTELKSIQAIANPMEEVAFYATKIDTQTSAYSGSASVHGRGSCKAAAGVTTDVSYVTREPWDRDVPCTHYLFPVARENTNLRAGFNLAIWNGFFGLTGSISTGPNLLPWPKFAPVAVNIACKSQRITVSAEADGAYSQMTGVDYLGVAKLTGSMRFIGIGGEIDIELSTKVVRLPPSIHGALTIAAAPNVNGKDAMKPYSSADSTFIMGTNMVGGVLMSAHIDNGDVVGSVLNPITNNNTVVATLGTTSIPTSGVYLYKFFAEPYDYDYLLLHYIVIDFADIL